MRVVMFGLLHFLVPHKGRMYFVLRLMCQNNPFAAQASRIIAICFSLLHLPCEIFVHWWSDHRRQFEEFCCDSPSPSVRIVASVSSTSHLDFQSHTFEKFLHDSHLVFMSFDPVRGCHAQIIFALLLASAGLSPKSEDGENRGAKQSAYERRVARFSVPARFYSQKNLTPSVGGAAGAKGSPKLKRVGQGAILQRFLFHIAQSCICF